MRQQMLMRDTDHRGRGGPVAPAAVGDQEEAQTEEEEEEEEDEMALGVVEEEEDDDEDAGAADPSRALRRVTPGRPQHSSFLLPTSLPLRSLSANDDTDGERTFGSGPVPTEEEVMQEEGAEQRKRTNSSMNLFFFGGSPIFSFFTGGRKDSTRASTTASGDESTTVEGREQEDLVPNARAVPAEGGASRAPNKHRRSHLLRRRGTVTGSEAERCGGSTEESNHVRRRESSFKQVMRFSLRGGRSPAAPNAPQQPNKHKEEEVERANGQQAGTATTNAAAREGASAVDDNDGADAGGVKHDETENEQQQEQEQQAAEAEEDLEEQDAAALQRSPPLRQHPAAGKNQKLQLRKQRKKTQKSRRSSPGDSQRRRQLEADDQPRMLARVSRRISHRLSQSPLGALRKRGSTVPTQSDPATVTATATATTLAASPAVPVRERIGGGAYQKVDSAPTTTKSSEVANAPISLPPPPMSPPPRSAKERCQQHSASRINSSSVASPPASARPRSAMAAMQPAPPGGPAPHVGRTRPRSSSRESKRLADSSLLPASPRCRDATDTDFVGSPVSPRSKSARDLTCSGRGSTASSAERPPDDENATSPDNKVDEPKRARSAEPAFAGVSTRSPSSLPQPASRKLPKQRGISSASGASLRPQIPHHHHHQPQQPSSPLPSASRPSPRSASRSPVPPPPPSAPPGYRRKRRTLIPAAMPPPLRDSETVPPEELVGAETAAGDREPMSMARPSLSHAGPDGTAHSRRGSFTTRGSSVSDSSQALMRPMSAPDDDATKTPARQMRILILGGSGVGKTCLVDRICHLDGGAIEMDPEPTVGIRLRRTTWCMGVQQLDGHMGQDIGGDNVSNDAFDQETEEDTRVTVQLWDTAGDPDLKTTTPMHLKKAHVVLVVFDAVDRDSFVAAESAYQEAKSAVRDGCQIVLVMNKTDLAEGGQGVVSLEAGSVYAKQRRMLFFSVSVVTGEGMRAMFEEVLRIGTERFPKCARTPIHSRFNSVASRGSSMSMTPTWHRRSTDSSASAPASGASAPTGRSALARLESADGCPSRGSRSGARAPKTPPPPTARGVPTDYTGVSIAASKGKDRACEGGRASSIARTHPLSTVAEASVTSRTSFSLRSFSHKPKNAESVTQDVAGSDTTIPGIASSSAAASGDPETGVSARHAASADPTTSVFHRMRLTFSGW